MIIEPRVPPPALSSSKMNCYHLINTTMKILLTEREFSATITIIIHTDSTNMLKIRMEKKLEYIDNKKWDDMGISILIKCFTTRHSIINDYPSYQPIFVSLIPSEFLIHGCSASTILHPLVSYVSP